MHMYQVYMACCQHYVGANTSVSARENGSHRSSTHNVPQSTLWQRCGRTWSGCVHMCITPSKGLTPPVECLWKLILLHRYAVPLGKQGATWGKSVAGHISGAQPMTQRLQPSDCRHVTQWPPARESKFFSLMLLPWGDGAGSEGMGMGMGIAC